MSKNRWKSIKFDRFEESPLPSGRHLLHCVFKDNWGNICKWAPRWKDVEKIFFKSVEIEERNEPEGVWDEELKRVARKIPSVRAFKLPVGVGCLQIRDLGENYCVTVQILGEEKEVSMNYRDPDCDSFRVGASEIKFLPLLERIQQIDASSETTYGIGVDPKSLGTVSGKKGGVCFNISLPKGRGKTRYEAATREISAVIRAYLREALACSRAIEEGFEDQEYEGGGQASILAGEKKNLSAMIAKWIPETMGRWFHTSYCDQALGITSRRDKNNRRQILLRLYNAGAVEKHPTKKGVYCLSAHRGNSSLLSK